MNSEIFNLLGIGWIDPAILFIIVLLLFIIVLIINIIQGLKLKKLKETYNSFMDGKDGKSLENEMLSLFEDIRGLKRITKKHENDINLIKDNLLITYQKIGLVRYDAFREMGGKLSFSVCILNDKNDGLILNSVHSTDGCYTYAKEIVNGESYINLGDEEKEALSKAINNEKIYKVGKRGKKKLDKNPLSSPEIEVDLESVNYEDYGFEEV